MLFAVTAVLYFIPAVAVPHKIFIPLTILALFSIKLTPWTITAGLAFSALGDLAGSFKMGGGTQEFYAFAEPISPEGHDSHGCPFEIQPISPLRAACTLDVVIFEEIV